MLSNVKPAPMPMVHDAGTMKTFLKADKAYNKKEFIKSISLYEKINPKFKEVHLNLGSAYRGINKMEEANKHYLLAADTSVPFGNGKYGEMPSAFNNLGLLHYAVGDDVTAMDYYRFCLSLEPLNYDAIWNFGNALLRSSACRKGWDHYEYRFKQPSSKFRMHLPTWDRVSSGPSICVMAEQGFGDKIMMGRYLHLLASRFSKVYVHCHESMNSLYSDYIPVQEPTGEYGIAVCSLPSIFGIDVNERWLDGKFTGTYLPGDYKIGCVWNGSPTHVNNHNRSCSSAYFSSLSSYGTLYSLNPSDRAISGISALRPKTWDQTAQYLLSLDLLVSVDTSIVHLAGTLGVPTLMVQPLYETDFRWSHKWYSSVEVISNPGSWDLTFKKVKERIECLKK